MDFGPILFSDILVCISTAPLKSSDMLALYKSDYYYYYYYYYEIQDWRTEISKHEHLSILSFPSGFHESN